MNYTEAIEINIGDSRERTHICICHGCGALVASISQHTAWHDALQRNLKNVSSLGFLATTKWPEELSMKS